MPAGGTLELHGMKKTSWVKLAQTVQPVEKTECSLVYDHADVTVRLCLLFICVTAADLHLDYVGVWLHNHAYITNTNNDDISNNNVP